MCALRLPAQAERIAGAVLPVASGDTGMVAERDSRGQADGPDAKQLGVRGAMHLLWDTGHRPAVRHDASRNPQLVHRGLRHRRPKGRQDFAR